MNYHNPGDPSDSQQPLRARVPDHVVGGAFSTGVIVMTAQSEFILDFVQNLGRPHQIVARVVMPHPVLPQLVDALKRNIDLYNSRWGELPSTATPTATSIQDTATNHPKSFGESTIDVGAGSNASEQSDPSTPGITQNSGAAPPSGPTAENQRNEPSSSQPSSGARQTTAQEVYDDLKIKDELLSGSYANAVMIGHGPHEFSFDFITNFYPNSAVSSRVFLAAGQVPRLLESLQGTWDQLRRRMQPPNGGLGPGPSSDPSPFDQQDGSDNSTSGEEGDSDGSSPP